MLGIIKLIYLIKIIIGIVTTFGQIDFGEEGSTVRGTFTGIDIISGITGLGILIFGGDILGIDHGTTELILTGIAIHFIVIQIGTKDLLTDQVIT